MSESSAPFALSTRRPSDTVTVEQRNGAPRASRLTRRDFGLAAHHLLLQHRAPTSTAGTGLGSLTARRYPLANGWQWHVAQGSEWTPGVGYLRQPDAPIRLLRLGTPDPDSSVDRLGDAEQVPDGDPDEVDPAAALAEHAESCKVRLSICYSPSYGVPVLWFEAHKHNGAPLTLRELLRTSVFHANHGCDKSLSVPPGQAPTPPAVLLSQADHPATGHFCWFLHPCETEAMVNEVLEASRDEPERGAVAVTKGRGSLPSTAIDSSNGRAAEWLEAWLMVVGGLVDLAV